MFAPHYASAIVCSAIESTPILAARPNGAVLSEILPGEGFEMLELATECAWGVCQGDGTVGFVARGALSYDDPAAPAPLSDSDRTTLAEMLIGCPAKPGGRSPEGFDAAGLIFYALTRTGNPCPRFIDLQEAELGEPVMGHPAYQRGELVFFADHVAMMLDGENAVHVTDSVVREPLSAIVAAFGDVVTRRRL